MGESSTGACFHAAYVFDISQTGGQELPEIGSVIGDPRLDGMRDDPRSYAFLRRLNLHETPMAKLPAARAPAAH